MVYPDVDFYKFEVDDDLQSYMGGEEKNEGIEPDDADSLTQSKEDVSEKPINVDSSAQLEAPVLNRTPLGNSAGVGGSLGDAGQTSAGVEGEKKGDITEVKWKFFQKHSLFLGIWFCNNFTYSRFLVVECLGALVGWPCLALNTFGRLAMFGLDTSLLMCFA